MEIEKGSSAGLAEKLLRGELDIAFIHRRRSLPLEGMSLLNARYGLVSLSGGPSPAKPLELSQLRDEEIGLFRRELAPVLHDEITESLDAQGVRTVAIPEMTDERIVNFVRRMGLPVLSFQPWGDDDAPEDLRFHEISYMPLALEFVIARDSRTPHAADLLWRHCAARLSQPESRTYRR